MAQQYGVRPLDPASPVPLTKQALEEVEKTDPLRRFRGTTYQLSAGNRLDRDWLLATPPIWGQPAAALPAGHSDLLLDRIGKLIATAEHVVDLTLLQPGSDGRFRDTLRAALNRLARSGRPVTARVMIGVYPPNDSDAIEVIRDLSRDLDQVPGSRLALYVGSTRSCNGEERCGALSWNHAKIIAVDGRRALVGGHNMWTADYLEADPVHDVAMQLTGPAARDAHAFADALWDFVCDRPSGDTLNTAWAYRPGGGIVRGCRETAAPPIPKASFGGVQVLSIGRLGTGIVPVFAAQSLLARDLLLGAARQSIRMVQQDVAFSATGVDRQWPEVAIEQVAKLIARGGDAYLVLSNLGAEGKVGDYSRGVPLADVAQKLRQALEARPGLQRADTAALLCRHLHLAPFRFGPDAAWPDRKPFGVHAKFWMVDERAFYIGSENLYPVELQEFGYVVEDRGAAQTALHDYWDQVWQWSSRAAISGPEAARCVFAPPS